MLMKYRKSNSPASLDREGEHVGIFLRGKTVGLPGEMLQLLSVAHRDVTAAGSNGAGAFQHLHCKRDAGSIVQSHPPIRMPADDCVPSIAEPRSCAVASCVGQEHEHRYLSAACARTAGKPWLNYPAASWSTQ